MAQTKKATTVLVATTSGTVLNQKTGEEFTFVRGQTHVAPDHWAVKNAAEGSFEPAEDRMAKVVEQATAAPGEAR